MSPSLSNIEPKELWNNFSLLNAVPRPSKKEERVIEFIMQFGKDLSLETSKDETGNVIIKKPASKGMEGKAIVALQSHLDMVHQKNGDTDFDFSTQGIEMYIDGDWVKAKGTTLGADNGIGVASIMTILASKDIVHPPIEALFTIDEETGMTGAIGLKGGLMHAKYMLNLDTEDDRELTIGCAGGVDVTATGTYPTEVVGGAVKALRVCVKGLTGGHSGMDIHLGRGNANKLMNRILTQAAEFYGISIHMIDGGSLRNAIPRESNADIIISAKSETAFVSWIKEIETTLKQEHSTTDPNLSVTSTEIEIPKTILNKEFQNKLLRTIYACPVGIYRMSPDIDRLVQTSNNLARVLVKDGSYSIQCLTRSSVDSEKSDLAQAIKSTFELLGASVAFAGAYPGWTPNPSSSIVKLTSNLYKEMYKEEPLVNACHAGLECGILGKNYPQMEMISFGPNIRGAHSPDEKVQITSVQKYWNFLLETLKRIPA
ncbi:aminoacyl-histidine dipeptidase [Aurantibacillus circumpalustris]|uniref:aminoacyl-histidine dipeptidase n=1 Tax=Aurantibacillus circumpalustris TaxID=3036359 RepID=UPI00295AD00F|nr:aminoacyl-histidine dipeptidase [Aurantibacillus circumpalustris]